MELNQLCQRLGYVFRQPQLLKEALSHRSVQGGHNNERLEYLGDAILNFVIAAALFRHNPQATEGELSRARAYLVCAPRLADLAQRFELGRYLRLGSGELKTGGAHRSSLLADAIEAVMGAVYLDAGFTICETCILNWYGDGLTNVSLMPETKDAKSRLQEYLQANRLPLPIYTILTIEGSPHQPLFQVECALSGLEAKAVGIGGNRRQAEQQAATKVLTILRQTID